MIEQEKIKDFAESITDFFLVFDGLFLMNENAEELLQETKSSLEKRVLHNESCLPVILAVGGNYDSEIDRAKIKEIESLQSLLKARKNLQKAIQEEQTKKSSNAEILSLFGL